MTIDRWAAMVASLAGAPLPEPPASPGRVHLAADENDGETGAQAGLLSALGPPRRPASPERVPPARK